jgi:hypothetical protein
MHGFPQGDKERLHAAARRVAREHGVEQFGNLTETILPDVHRFELTMGDAALEFSSGEVQRLFEALITYARK